MKKILYTLLAGAMALVSCSKSDEMPTAPQTESTTFTLSVDELQTRATSTITPARYVMEVWSEDGMTAENVFDNAGTPTNRKELTTGSITVTLDKTKAYTCLFWADDNTTFNAASLKAISLNTGKEVAEAYFSKVAVAKGKNPAIAVTLKRAVAKITLTETAVVKVADDIALKLSNIYPTFSVLDGTATGTAAEWTKTVKPAATTGVIGTFYFFAKAEKELSDLTFTYAAETEKAVNNIPVQQNHATNIKGEYSNVGSFTFTVTANDEWNTPDNEAELPKKANIGDFYMKDGTCLPAATTLSAEQQADCIGIVYWIGDPTINDAALKVAHPNCTHGLVVALKEEASTWQLTYEYDKPINNWTTTNTTYAPILSGNKLIDPINKIMGYNNTKAIQAFNAANTGYKVEVIERVVAYQAAVPTPASNSGWFLPSMKELTLLCGLNNQDLNVYENKFGKGNRDTINAQLTKITNSMQLSKDDYWSSTENSFGTVWFTAFDGGVTGNHYKYTSMSFRVVSAF